MKVTGEIDRRKKNAWDKRYEKNESQSRGRQKKDEWIRGKTSRKDEIHRRDRDKKEDWIGGKMSRDETVCCKCTRYCKRKPRIKFKIKKETAFSLNKLGV